jgi:D-alanine-D-alanine ligase
MGGLSAEREISLLSGSAVLAALKNRGVDAHGVDVDENIVSELSAGDYQRAFIISGFAGTDEYALHRFRCDGVITGNG